MRNAAEMFSIDQCCGSGIGAFLTPGSGIRNRFFPDPVSRIPNPYFWELSDNFFGIKFYNSLKIGPNFFLQLFNTKIICNFVKFVATLKVMTTNFFHPSLLLLFLDPWSEIRDPGWVKSGSATLPFSHDDSKKSLILFYFFTLWVTAVFRICDILVQIRIPGLKPRMD